MKCHRPRLTLPREPRTAPADHHHAIADPHFAVDTTCRPNRAERLLSLEHALHELDHSSRVLYHRIGCHRAEALADRIHRWLRRLLHCLEATVHFLD